MPEFGLQYGARAVVSGIAPDCLALLDKPGNSDGSLGCLKEGTIAQVTDGPEFVGPDAWLKLDRKGWVAASYLKPAPEGGPSPTARPTLPPTATKPVPPTGTPTAIPPTRTPTPVPPTRTPTPTATPTAVIPIVLTASVSNASPTRNSRVTVSGTLTQGRAGISGVKMETTWHYEKTTSACSGVTDSKGTASCTRNISTATSGYFVLIDVSMTYQGQTYTTSTGFTPQ
jgi:hypothetical protein